MSVLLRQERGWGTIGWKGDWRGGRVGVGREVDVMVIIVGHFALVQLCLLLLVVVLLL